MSNLDEKEDQSEPAWLEQGIALANVPTLACMLVQLTGDRRWIEGRYIPTRVRGLDDNDSGGLPHEVQEEIRRAALDALRAWFSGRPLAMPNPSDAQLLELMGISLGDEIPAAYAPMIRRDLELPPESSVEAAPSALSPVSHEVRALFVGAVIS